MTATDGTLLRSLKLVNDHINKNDINDKIKAEVDKSLIRLGKLVKYYHYLDKAEVRLKNGEVVLCKMPHMFLGDLVDFFTPSGDADFDEERKEVCITPLAPLPCAVLNINSDDSKEWLLLCFYHEEELTSFKPAPVGSMKISCAGVANEYYISFGNGELKVFTNDGVEMSTGFHNEIDNTEYYTKSEVDELLKDLKNELKKEQEEG